LGVKLKEIFPPMEKRFITFQTQKITLKQKSQLQKAKDGFALKKKLRHLVGERQKNKTSPINQILMLVRVNSLRFIV